MRFPYTEVGPGIHRPIVPARVWGPSMGLLADGLADTASDRTLLTRSLAHRLGINVDRLGPAIFIQTASGELLPFVLTTATVEIARDSRRISWIADIAIPLVEIKICHWGHKGFLEHFNAQFDGPNRELHLGIPKRFPKVKTPSY